MSGEDGADLFDAPDGAALVELPFFAMNVGEVPLRIQMW